MEQNPNSTDQFGKTLDPVVGRLSRWIFARYATELFVLPLRPEDPRLRQIAEQLTNSAAPDQLHSSQCSHPVITEDTAYFPVWMKGELTALASVAPIRHLSTLQIQELSNVVEMILTSAFTSVRERDALIEIETQLNLAHTELSNILRFTRTRNSADGKRDPVAEEKIFNRQKDVRFFQLPCLIESKSEEDIRKLALEIHDRSGRYAFVHFEHLDPEVLATPETLTQALAQVGNVTLFCPRIEDLSKSQQQLVCEYLKAGSNWLRPTFVIGTQRTYIQLLNDENIYHEVLKLSSVVYLKMQTTFAEYAKQGVTRLFLQGLNSQPSAQPLL